MTDLDKFEHLKSDSNISKPELETLDYKPEQPGVPVLAADVNGKLLEEKELRALDKHIKQNSEKHL